MDLSKLVLDNWSSLSHKAIIGDLSKHHATARSMAPTWVPVEQRRRLDAYKILTAYTMGVAKHFLATTDQAEIREHREYGDAALLVDRIVAGILGDDVQVVVTGADEELPDEPNLPPEPQEPGPDANDIERRVYQLRAARWQAEATKVVDDWDAAWQALPTLQARQEWLRDWAEDEQLIAKLVEAEGDAAGLGDWVLVMGWDAAKQRPVVQVWDPGFYFPVLEDDPSGSYPSKVHIAWEFEEGNTTFVRRLTWELVPLGLDVDADEPTMATRVYPWNAEPSAVTCRFSDGTWDLSKIDTGSGLPDLGDKGATWAVNAEGEQVRELDLLIDFLPVIHCPHTPATREHWGKSTLMAVSQILDDIGALDTDIQKAAELTAGPAIALSGAQANTDMVLRRSTVFNLGAEGSMTVLDLSQGLSELRETKDDLLDRLSVVSKVPAEMLGRVNSSEVASGFLFALATAPFGQMANVLRMVRTPRWRLVLKFAQRLAMAGGVLDGEVVPAEIVPGSYLPSDLAQTVTQVVSLLQAHGISRRTALRLLVDSGVDIGDLSDELDAIVRDDVEGARLAADATGDENVARERLGLEAVDEPVVQPPPIVPPGAPVLPPEQPTVILP